MAARPLSGMSTVHRMRTAVVFPAPLGPRTPSTVPGGVSNESPSSASTFPLANVLVRSCASIAGGSGILAPYDRQPG